jgi:beta-glucosidase
MWELAHLNDSIKGIYVGYRSYNIRKLAPLFPFGYGLSYTTFKYSDLQVSDISKHGQFKVTVAISNTGMVDGREIVQVYIRDEKSSLPRPLKELKAFTKVLVRSGQSKVVSLQLDREALGFYDDRAKHWIAEKGVFVVHVAASSDDECALEAAVELKHDITWKGL